MKQEFYNLQINTDGQKLYEFTDQTFQWIEKNNFKNGILNLSIQRQPELFEYYFPKFFLYSYALVFSSPKFALIP